MREPERSNLLAVTANSKLVGPRWVAVVAQKTSYDHAGAYHAWYREAAMYFPVDQTLCRLLVEDMGGKIEVANGTTHVVPDWLRELHGTDPDNAKSLWPNDPVINKYCIARGYEPK